MISKQLLEIALTNATGAAVLALIAVVVERRWRRPELTHLLWLLVLLRLLMPPGLELGLPLLPATESLALASPVAADTAFAAPAASPAGPTLSKLTGLFVLWLAGVIGVLGLAVVRIVGFRRRLAVAGRFDGELQTRVITFAERMGIARAPRVSVVDATMSPMLWAAFGSRTLVVPAGLLGQLSSSELDTLLVHELAHLRRRDHWVRHLELAAVTLFWWYPLSWWARRRLRRADEQCCDALVARTLPEHRRDYADCLLRTLRYLASATDRSSGLALASGLGEANDLKGRLTMIMTDRIPKRLSVLGRTLFAVAALVLLVVYPTLAERGADATLAASESPSFTLGEILRSLAARSGDNFVIPPGVDLSVPVALELEGVDWSRGLELADVDWHQTLISVLRQSGLTSRWEGNVLWISRENPAAGERSTFVGRPIDMSLQRADLGQTLDSFATISGLAIELEAGIEGTVTVELDDVPWDQALDAILRINRLESTLIDGVLHVHRPRIEMSFP